MVDTQVAITTIDNPYNPFTEFENWMMFDIEKKYNTCGKLARFARTSDEFTDEENNLEVEQAIDEIIKFDPFNIYKKVRITDDIDYRKTESVDHLFEPA